MQMDSVPAAINRDAWINALESLGIPVRGERLTQLVSGPGYIVATYLREDEDGSIPHPGCDAELLTIDVRIAITDGA